MTLRRFNWPLLVGFVFTIAAFLTYFFVFVWFPVTRDFPWANLLIFVVALVFLFMGVRRGFAADRPHPIRSKIVTSIVATLSVVIIGLFVFTIFVGGRWLPASKGAASTRVHTPRCKRKASLAQRTADLADQRHCTERRLAGLLQRLLVTIVQLRVTGY
jgi:hypothetical protein